MAFNCRIFGYRGLRQIRHIQNVQFTSDTVYALEDPYVWSQVFSINGAVQTPAFVTVPNDVSQVIGIEVQIGMAVRYEINPPGRNVQAGTQSKRLQGWDVYPWGQGFSVSLVDAAAFP
jgi:hypothetical protein